MAKVLKFMLRICPTLWSGDMRSKDYFAFTIELVMCFVIANILVFSLASKYASTPEVRQQEVQKIIGESK